MYNVYNTRAEAFKLASQPNNPNDTSNHSEYSSIYIAPTSNVIDAMKQYSNYENVLAVGGTGAFGFEAALNGAKEVDMFDINELQRMYFEIIYTAIMVFDYEEFIKYFTTEKGERLLKGKTYFFEKCKLDNLLSNDFYNEICYFLPDDVAKVFDPLYDYHHSQDLVTSKLFRTQYQLSFEHLKKYASIYNKEQYYKIKKILIEQKCKFTYQTMSLTDVPKKYDKKYDLIILDNILQYYKNIPDLNTPYLVNMFIQKKLSNLLTEDGVIQVNYAFEIGTDAVREKFNAPGKRELGFIEKAIAYQEIKDGINVPLLDKWDGYNYEIIPGVERDEGNKNADNLVLSWRKTKR